MVRMPPKTTCPISRVDFLAKAEPLKLDLGNGQTLIAEPREFSANAPDKIPAPPNFNTL